MARAVLRQLHGKRRGSVNSGRSRGREWSGGGWILLGPSALTTEDP